jgi:hypothetical protein
MSLALRHDPSRSFSDYLASLDWGPGVTKNHQTWRAALRAASLGIDRNEALQKISSAIQRAGGVLVEAKVRRDLEKAGSPATWNQRGQKSESQQTVVRIRRWPGVNDEQREAVISQGVGAADLWEASPIRGDLPTEEIIDSLFSRDCLLCAGQSKSRFETKEREQWRGRLANLQLIVPNPMCALKGLTQKGKMSAHSLNNTGRRRFLVIEQDSGTADEQAAVLVHLATRGPLALAVGSGGKSIHGWFYCAGMSDEQLWPFMAYAHQLGACHSTWTRSQFVRMPGGLRDNGKRQPVLFFNPEVVR